MSYDSISLIMLRITTSCMILDSQILRKKKVKEKHLCAKTKVKVHHSLN